MCGGGVVLWKTETEVSNAGQSGGKVDGKTLRAGRNIEQRGGDKNVCFVS